MQNTFLGVNWLKFTYRGEDLWLEKKYFLNRFGLFKYFLRQTPTMILEIFSMPIILISNASQANPNKSISTHNPDISHGNDFRGGWRRNWKRKWFSKNIFSSLNELLINTFSCARQLSSYFLRHSSTILNDPPWTPWKRFFSHSTPKCRVLSNLTIIFNRLVTLCD